MLAFTAVLSTALAMANAAGYCDVAAMSAFSGIIGGDCTPVNDTCPMGCGMLLHSTVASCQDENLTLGGAGGVRPFQAGMLAAGLSPFLQGPCVEALVDAVFNSTTYSATCMDGALLFLSASGSLCGGSAPSTPACPEECQHVVDAVFDHCESTEVLDLNGTELSAAQLVGAVRLGGLSPECSAFFDTRTFIGEANSSGRPGPFPMPMPPMVVASTECDEAFRSAGPAVYGGACLAFGGDVCPEACQEALESLLTICAGANFTLFPSGHVVPFPPSTAIGIAQALPRACQEVPLEILLNLEDYEPACEDSLQLFVGAAGIPACRDDGASICPEVCRLLVSAPFDHCQETDNVHINGTEFVARDLVAMLGSPLSGGCSAVLGARVFENGSWRPDVLPLPMPPMPGTSTECDEALRSALPAIYGGACLTFGDTCPMACRGALESLLTTCVAADAPFPPSAAVGIAQLLPRACQEVPLEILLNLDAYDPACEDALQLFAGAAAIPACRDEGAETCPEICRLLIGAPFDLCRATERVNINGTEYVAGDLVAMQGVPLSVRCSEVLGARDFGVMGSGSTTAMGVHSTLKPDPSTTASMMMATSTTIPDDDLASSAAGAVLSGSLVAVAVALVLDIR